MVEKILFIVGNGKQNLCYRLHVIITLPIYY